MVFFGKLSINFNEKVFFMSDSKKNKIDSAIDEVVESKRLRQGFSFLFKSIIGLIILFFVLLLIGVAAGIIG